MPRNYDFMYQALQLSSVQHRKARNGPGDKANLPPYFFLHTCTCSFITEFVVQSSAVRFSDVGGCSECLREVNKFLLHMKQPVLFARLGVRPPQGFLLHGPPGSGKTLIANAIAGVSVIITQL